MRNLGVARARPGHAARWLWLLAAAAAGCSDGDYGSVPAAPKSSPEVVQAKPSGKGGPAPRVPRGPAQAKALQEATAR
jgi:hypothetical protein